MNDARGARLLSSAISPSLLRSRRARRHTHARAPRRSLESRGRARPLRLLRRPPPLSERARIAGSRRPVSGSFPNDRARAGVVAEPGAPFFQEGPRAFFLCPFAAPPASPPARARAPDRGRPPRGRPNAGTTPPPSTMTVGNILVRNHNALAKACLGGGFAFGFAYTNNHGTNPIRDAATAAGTRARPRDPPLSVRASPNATGRSRPSPRADTRRGASRRASRARLRRGALPLVRPRIRS